MTRLLGRDTGRRVLLCVLSMCLVAAGRQPAPRLDSVALARVWDAEHVSPPLPGLLRHAEVARRLEALRSKASDLFTIEEAGRSVEGRTINLVTIGRGVFPVLLWSQMHGDEPTATSALFDLFEYLRRHRDEPPVARILATLTLHVIPMLNPDGAERFQRRNAQGIDINRDALLLQTPEGRALKTVRDRLQPALGFNLHNQSWRTSIGDPPRAAAISLLSVAYDEARTENARRRLTKKVCAVLRDALEPLAGDRVGRYDDEFEVRAFGDNLTKWGTPVVLIETGPWPGPDPDAALVRMNFAALVTALDALASGSVENADPRRYESLPMNESRLFTVLIRHATIVPGGGVPAFRGDVGIGSNRVVRDRDGHAEAQVTSRIEDLGDLRVYGALETIDADGMTVAPLPRGGAKPGDLLSIDRGVIAAGAFAIGAPADLVLVKAVEDQRYRVERVFRSDRAQ